MPFKKILVGIDGSSYSQTAINYAFWLASKLQASLTAEHVIDPRLADQIVAPEFAQTLGFSMSLESSEKVYAALEKIGKLILNLFSQQAAQKELVCDTVLEAGWIAERIVAQAEKYDLVILGHHGWDSSRLPPERIVGSIAERVVLSATTPVLVALRPLAEIKQILVAFDGSEASRGALLAGEALALKTGKPLVAITVAPSADKLAEAHLTVEQGSSLLHNFKDKDTFKIVEGPITKTILDYAHSSGSLVIIGAYGYRTHEENVLGSTTTGVLRRSKTSVLVYRQ